MAVWQYTLSLLPAESVQDLPSSQVPNFLGSFAAVDVYDFSPLWAFRQQQAQKVRETIGQFLKPAKDSMGVPAYGSRNRSLFILQETDGAIRDFTCKIDVRAMQEMRMILTEILAIAKAHNLFGMHEDYGLIPLTDAFHLLRSISQSRAVRYVRDPQAYLDQLHEANGFPQSQTPLDASHEPSERESGASEADPNTAPPETTKMAS